MESRGESGAESERLAPRKGGEAAGSSEDDVAPAQAQGTAAAAVDEPHPPLAPGNTAAASSSRAHAAEGEQGAARRLDIDSLLKSTVETLRADIAALRQQRGEPPEPPPEDVPAGNRSRMLSVILESFVRLLNLHLDRIDRLEGFRDAHAERERRHHRLKPHHMLMEILQTARRACEKAEKMRRAVAIPQKTVALAWQSWRMKRGPTLTVGGWTRPTEKMQTSLRSCLRSMYRNGLTANGNPGGISCDRASIGCVGRQKPDAGSFKCAAHAERHATVAASAKLRTGLMGTGSSVDFSVG
eukprot:tig00021123_g18517.t1